MADVFGQETKFGLAFQANLARMNFVTDANGNGGLGVLVQNVRAQYGQQVTRLWELSQGEPKTYYVVGRAQGEMSIARIIGPSAIATDFVTKFSQPCLVSKNSITLDLTAGYKDANCQPSTTPVKRKFNNCLITSLALQMSAQDMLVQEQVALMYTEQEHDVK